jgi:hypothetical protein
MLRRITLVASLCLLLGGNGVLAAVPRVEYSNDRLTLHAEDAPLTDILEALKRQSGAEIRGEPPARPNVTMNFESVPAREGLERLLGDRSFTLTYGEDGKLKVIDLKGGPQARAPEQPAAPPPPGGVAPKEKWDTLMHALVVGPRKMTPGRLRPESDEEQPDWETLLRMASQNEDRRERRKAWRAGIRAVEESHERRNALIAAVGSFDDAELSAFARAMAAQTPDGVEDLAKLVARECRVPEIRVRARALVRQLRQERMAAAGKPAGT